MLPGHHCCFWEEHYREAPVVLQLRARVCTCKCVININASSVSLQKEMEITISLINCTFVTARTVFQRY